MVDKEFFAHVHWWDAWTVCVKCPFCMKIHKHGFGGSYEDVYRVAHCDSSPPLLFPSYQLKFPFSQALETTAYKIDKASKRYVAIDANSPQPMPDLLVEGSLPPRENPAVALETFEDAVETIVIDKTDKIFRRLHEAFGGDETSTVIRIEHVLNRMIFFGDEDYIRDYLDSSPESRIFLHGVRDDNGESALSCAACERFPATVKLLLDRGSNANFQNRDGRTPLMQAALWGRYKNVRHLLKHGADKNLQDSDGFKAIDFADSSDRNQEERYRRLEENQTYKEVTPTANQARRMIFHLLKDAEVEIEHGSNKNFESYTFQKQSQGFIKLVAPIAAYPVTSQWKTIARLERGHKNPPVVAMSGWSHGNTTASISGRDWTSEVIRIANILGYTITPYENRDSGIPGQYYACHAEMQLIAYLISKHVFLEPEIRAPKTICDPTDPQKQTKEGLEDDSSKKADFESGKKGPLLELAIIMPPAMLKRATILVSSPPCEDCSQFNKFVNLKLGLSISLLNCSEVR